MSVYKQTILGPVWHFIQPVLTTLVFTVIFGSIRRADEPAAVQRAGQFEAWDMISGQMDPGLGGQPRYLDVMGLNYYHANQWEHPDLRLRWENQPRDKRWVPLHHLLAEVYNRYPRPLFIGETSHFGGGRGPWLKEIYDEVQTAIKMGVPLEGITISPILDRPDWDDLEHWHNSGLWDLVLDEQGVLQRVLDEDYAAVFREILQNNSVPERWCHHTESWSR